MRLRALPYLVHVTLLVGLYVSTAKVGLWLDAVGGFATAVWPPTGLALAALVLGGYHLWPGITLGAFFVNAWAGAPLPVAAGMALGNTLEALVGAALLTRVVRRRPALDRLRDVAGLAGAAVLSTLLSATVGVTSGWLGGVIPTATYGEAWSTWWLGDMNGDLVVAALLLTWSARPRTYLSSQSLLEGAGLLFAIVALSLLVFAKSVASDIIDFSYLLFPVLIWAALRFGPPGASAATAIVSTLAIWGTAHGGGPFLGGSFHQSVLALQAFMTIVAGTVLVLAAVVAERKRAERRLVAHDATTRLLAETAAPGDVIPRVLQTICDSLDWDMGALWHVDREAYVLRHGESWHRPSTEVAGFEAMCRQYTLASGVGLPGRVWASGEPAWIIDVADDTNFPRAPMAAQAGLHGAFAFPLRLGTDILGVIEFFSRERRLPDDELLHMVATIGSQLGQFLERTRAERALRASEERLRRAAQAAGFGTYDFDLTTGQSYWSPELKALCGLSEDAPVAVGDDLVPDCVHPEDHQRVRELMGASLDPAGSGDFEHEHRILPCDGATRWVLVRGKTLFTGKDATRQAVRAMGIVIDITARKHMEEQLEVSLREKEVLLKEIHHRVKNNLQIICSLLGLQSEGIHDPDLRELFHESERRIRAMALIHETLYQADDLARFDVAHYLRTLSTQLFRSYGVSDRRIALKIHVENLSLALDTAIPCGLVFNELLSNALKHAFLNEQTGEITITFEAIPAGHATLRVQDTGVGFPEGLDFRDTDSLGLQLVCALTKQLQGTIELERNGGTTFTLTFPLPDAGQRRREPSASTPPLA